MQWEWTEYTILLDKIIQSFEARLPPKVVWNHYRSLGVFSSAQFHYGDNNLRTMMQDRLGGAAIDRGNIMFFADEDWRTAAVEANFSVVVALGDPDGLKRAIDGFIKGLVSAADKRRARCKAFKVKS